MLSQEIKDYISGEITEITYPNSFLPEYCFAGCTKLETINCDMSSGFQKLSAYSLSGTESLTDINLENVQSIDKYTFNKCGLEEILLPNLNSTVSSYGWADGMFQNCPNLTKLLIGKDFNKALNSSTTISGCNALIEIWLLSESTVITLSSSALNACDHYKTNGDRTGRIYVPQAMVESYKNTSAFANYKDLIVGISELPNGFSELFYVENTNTPMTGTSTKGDKLNVREVNKTVYLTLVGKSKRTKIYDESEKLVHDFVPCYKEETDENGFYDLVENKFYSNAKWTRPIIEELLEMTNIEEEEK